MNLNLNVNQIENPQRAARRGACAGAPSSTHRRRPATAERVTRSAGSEARAADAVINAYARGVATTRVARAPTAA